MEYIQLIAINEIQIGYSHSIDFCVYTMQDKVVVLAYMHTVNIMMIPNSWNYSTLEAAVSGHGHCSYLPQPETAASRVA